MDTMHHGNPLGYWVLGVADSLTHWAGAGLPWYRGFREGGGGGAESHRVTATEAPREFFFQ